MRGWAAAVFCAGQVLAADLPKGGYYQQPPELSPLKLLFSDPEDVYDTWGRIGFGASPIRPIGNCENPGFELKCCMPREDGTWDVYGYTGGHDIYGEQGDPTKQLSRWRIHHALTKDGVHYAEAEVVFESAPGAWTHFASIAHNPLNHELLCIKGVLLKEGFENHVYHSKDGRQWIPGERNPVYYDGDSWGQLWSPRLRRWVTTTKSFQIVRKHLPDHGNTRTGQVRRVCSVRSSQDGDHWEPSDPVLIHAGAPLLPVDLLITPDEKDPPELEFYRGVGFGYADRCFLMMLNYAASPPPVNPRFPDKHGPQLDTEWWFSREGLKWSRPFREVDATPDGVRVISHNPMIIGGKLLFHFGDKLFGMPEDRLTYLSARANVEFSTRTFSMPSKPLMLNAAIPSPDRPYATDQAYVMVAVLDEQDRVVQGYEREKCILKNLDKTNIPLRWADKDNQGLKGRKVRLRFFARAARIYAVSEVPADAKTPAPQ